MPDESLFGDDQSPVAPPVVAPTTPSLPPELAELVGEGKKYKSVDAAIAALPHAQSHIAKLEAEAATLREELAKRRTTQELLDEIKSGIPKGETAPNKEIDHDAVANLVKKVVSETEAVKVQTANTANVVNAFKEQFGDKAEEFYNKVAAEAGMSVGTLNQLAKTSPQAVLKLAGIGKAPTPAMPGKVRSDVNTQGFNGNSNAPLSSKVIGHSTQDMLRGWKTAGEKVKQSSGQ